MSASDKTAATPAAEPTGLKRFLLTPRYGGVAALAGIIVVLQFFFTNNFHYDVAINIGLAAIVCVGLNLLIGYAGQISLGHAGFFGLGAYSSAILTDAYGWPPIAAMAAGMVLVGVLSFVLARPILKLKGHYLAMATLGMGIIISIVLNQEVELTGGPDGMAVPAFSVLGWQPQSETAWSKAERASRRAPSPLRASSISEASSAVTLSCVQISCRCTTMSGTGMRRKSNRWQRERMVAGTFCGSVVAKTNFTCGGGSSSVFRSALKAASVSMWTSSIM